MPTTAERPASSWPDARRVTDPRASVLILDRIDRHSQQCPVWTRRLPARTHDPNRPTRASASDCNCWRKPQAFELLARIDAVDPLRATPAGDLPPCEVAG